MFPLFLFLLLLSERTSGVSPVIFLYTSMSVVKCLSGNLHVENPENHANATPISQSVSGWVIVSRSAIPCTEFSSLLHFYLSLTIYLTGTNWWAGRNFPFNTLSFRSKAYTFICVSYILSEYHFNERIYLYILTIFYWHHQ